MIIIKQIKKLLVSLVVAYIPSLLIIVALLGGDAIFFDTPFVFDLLIVILYTFPTFVGIIGLLLCLVRYIEGDKHISIFDIITMLMALSAIVASFTLIEMIYIPIILAILLVIFESVRCVRDKSIKKAASFLGQGSFWIIVLAIILTVALCSGIYRCFVNDEGKVDPFEYADEIVNNRYDNEYL